MNPLRKLLKFLRRKHRKTPRRRPARTLNVFRSARGGGLYPRPWGYEKIKAKQLWLYKHGGSHPLTRARGDALRALVGR